VLDFFFGCLNVQTLDVYETNVLNPGGNIGKLACFCLELRS
jgi:hypothetical protein